MRPGTGIPTRESPRVRAGRGRDMPTQTMRSPMLGSMPRTRCMPPYGLIGMMPNTGSLINASPRSEHTCPGEMSKSSRLAQIAQSVFLDERSARLVASEFGIRAPDSSLQSLLFNVPGALPLAMLLLPESFSRAGARLDERNLSAVGSRPRGYDSRPSTGIRRRHL